MSDAVQLVILFTVAIIGGAYAMNWIADYSHPLIAVVAAMGFSLLGALWVLGT